MDVRVQTQVRAGVLRVGVAVHLALRRGHIEELLLKAIDVRHRSVETAARVVAHRGVPRCAGEGIPHAQRRVLIFVLIPCHTIANEG